MALPAFILPLLAQGLNLIGNAAMVKGKEWIKDKTGVDLDVANLSQEEFVKLKQYEMEHEEELLRLQQEDDRLEVELEKAYLADRDSARQMQMTALQQDDTFSKRFVYWFAIGWSLIAGVYIFGITFGTIPEENVRFADTVLGFMLGTIVATILQFFFGSSRSSQKKDDRTTFFFDRVVDDVVKK